MQGWVVATARKSKETAKDRIAKYAAVRNEESSESEDEGVILVRRNDKEERVRSVRQGELLVEVGDNQPLSSVWADFGRTDITYVTYVNQKSPISGNYRICYGDEEKGRNLKSYTYDEMVALVGIHVTRFARDSRLTFSRTLTSKTAGRLGLMNSGHDNFSYEGGQPVGVDWVLEDVWLSTGGNGEEEGVYYGRGVGEKVGYKIDLYTFQQWGQEGSVDDEPQSSREGFWKGKRTQAVVVLEIDNWCKDNPGRGRWVHSSKAREPSVRASQYFDYSKPVLCKDDTTECARASFANSLALIDGPSAAMEYWEGQPASDSKRLLEVGYRPSLRSIRRLCVHVEESVKGVTLRYVRGFDGTKVINPHVRFFTRGWKKSIFVVTMRGTGEFLHSICVDTRSSPGFIYDSSEPFSMRLCAESLKLCVGDQSIYLGMTDLREVVRHTSLERLRKKRKRPSRGERKKRRMLTQSGPGVDEDLV